MTHHFSRPADATAADWRAREAAHTVYGWQPQALRSPRLFTHAEGSALYDQDGNRVLDFGSGQISVNIGYSHPHVLAAMERQMRAVTYLAPSFATEARLRLAEAVAAVTPGDLNHIFFTNGGAEAVENALKIARAVTGRWKILSAWQSYHGATAMASAVSGDGRRLLSEPGVPGVARFNLPGLWRSAFNETDPEAEVTLALEAVETLIQREGPTTIAALILEPVVGTNGLYNPGTRFLRGIRTLCDRYGILLVADETMSGWGRTGAWFAVDHAGVVPDLLTTAKGITSGYVPLGAVALRPALYEHFRDRPFVGGLTTEGHALACAAGVATLEVYHQEGLIARSAERGAWLLDHLRGLQDRHPCIGTVRGIGLFTCLELTADRNRRTPLAGTGPVPATLSREIAARCLKAGLVVLARQDFIFIAPPLSVPQTDLEDGLAILDTVLQWVDTLLPGSGEAPR